MQGEADSCSKQEYLRQQIVNQGYSPEDFMEYLMTLKSSGEEINNWTTEQLQKAVESYKSKQTNLGLNRQISAHKQEAIDESVISKFQVFGQKEIKELSLQKEQRVQYQKSNLYDSPLIKTVECLEYKGFLEDVKNVKVDIIGFQIKTTGGKFFGIGKTTELWYVVKCSIIDSTIQRSDKDFVWLRNTLSRLNPGHFIPPYSGVAQIEKETDSNFQRRRQLANLFLKSLQQDKVVFNSKLVISFLTWSDYNRFTQSKTTYDSSTFTKILSKLHTKDAKVGLEISKSNMNMIKASETLGNKVEFVHEKLIQQVNYVAKQFQSVSSSIYQLGHYFKEFQETYSTFYNTIPQVRNQSMVSTLITINNILLDWGKTFGDYQSCLKETLVPVLEYNKMQMQSMIEMIGRRNSWKGEYLKFKENLIKKKEKILLDQSKWQLPPNIKAQGMQKFQLTRYILPKETETQYRLKEYLAYINKQTQLQIQRVIQMNRQRLSIYWTNFGIQTLKSTQDSIQIWKEVSNGILLKQRKSSFYQ